MKKLLLLFAVVGLGITGLFSQCTTSNSTDCVCEDGSDDCDLLPDITISWYALENYLSGPTEEPGIVYVTGSTPNIGLGSFTVRGGDDAGYRYFVCGDDTISIYDPYSNETFECPNGGEAEQIIFQRIYHKNGPTMTYWDREMEAMTYHPNHGHNHFDEWGIFSLRIEDENEADPRNWPVIGTGAKVGFCLMDYYTCGSGSAVNHCMDDNTTYNSGNYLQNEDFPNFGLGGGNYGCGMIEQGISSGYTDVYSEYLDGMWIDIPDGTCNGDYWIVYEVDPNEVVLESNEDNNWTAIPFTLTEQTEVGNPFAAITSTSSPIICEGGEVSLTASPGLSFNWSNGDSTQTVTVGAGTYSVEVESYCGTAISSEVVVSEIAKPDPPITTSDTVCVGSMALLSAEGDNVVWFNAEGIEIGTGNEYLTEELQTTASFFAAEINATAGEISTGAKFDNSGGGSFFSGDQYLRFDAEQSFILNSVKVYALGAADRTIQLKNNMGNVVAQGEFFIENGEQVVDLGFEVPVGNGYRITAIGDSELYRNNEGVNFPYETPGVLSVTTSSAGDDYYYFFYDWEVEVGAGRCPSDFTETVAEVINCDGIEESFNLDVDWSNMFQIFPNPSSGKFTINFSVPRNVDIGVAILDMAGRSVYEEILEEVNDESQRHIDISHVMAGMYVIRFDVGANHYYKCLSKQ